VQRLKRDEQLRAQDELQASAGSPGLALSARGEGFSVSDAGWARLSTWSRMLAAGGRQDAGAAAAFSEEKPAIPRARTPNRKIARMRFMAVTGLDLVVDGGDYTNPS